jgi:hypothetical protein
LEAMLATAFKIFKRRHGWCLKISKIIKFSLVLELIFLSAVGDGGNNF